MRNMIRASIVAVALALGGCATPGGGPSPSVNVIVDQIVAMTGQVCKFVPTVGTVVSLITANPAWTTAADFAVAICNAVTAPKGARRLSRRGIPMVGNVVINGRFVR